MLRARIWTVVATQTHRDASGWARTGMMPCAPYSQELCFNLLFTPFQITSSFWLLTIFIKVAINLGKHMSIFMEDSMNLDTQNDI